MRIYIMTDLEGVCGVLDSANWCLSDGRYYEQAKELLTLEVNAAVDGFLAGGATEILVADGHGSGGLNPSLLSSSVQLACNWPVGRAYPFSMDSDSFDFAAWIGQHPKAGSACGHICHTGTMGIREQTINGISVGEFGELVFCAWELGIRAIFASGCEAFTREARDLVPDIETVAVKRGTQSDPGHNLPEAVYREHNAAAIHLSVIEARERISAGARRAIERAKREKFGGGRLEPPFHRVRILRSTGAQPPRKVESHHADSVIALLNDSQGTCRSIAYDPAAINQDP